MDPCTSRTGSTNRTPAAPAFRTPCDIRYGFSNALPCTGRLTCRGPRSFDRVIWVRPGFASFPRTQAPEVVGRDPAEEARIYQSYWWSDEIRDATHERLRALVGWLAMRASAPVSEFGYFC